MKRYPALIGSAILAITSVCGFPASKLQVYATQEETEEADSDVLLDDQYIKITYEGVTDEEYYVGYKVLIENKTSDQYISLYSTNTSVNGMMQYMSVQNSTVAPGMKAEAKFLFNTDSEGAIKSVNDLINVKGILNLGSNTDGGSIFNPLEYGIEFTIPASVKENSENQEQNDVPAAAVLLDDQYASITYDGTVKGSNYVGYKVIFENKTSDQYLLLSADNTSVDGMMQYMDIQNSTVAPEMKVETELRFNTDNSGIKSIDDLKDVKGTFHISSSADGGVYYELESGIQFSIPSEEDLANVSNVSDAQDTATSQHTTEGASADAESTSSSEIDGLSVLTSSDGYMYSLKDDNTATLTGCPENVSDVVNLILPDKVDEHTVTELGETLFDNIGSQAKTITIPDSIEKIDGNPFMCTSLTGFSVSPNHLYYAVIDNVLFEKKTKRLVCYPQKKTDISDYTVPDGIKEIGAQAFFNAPLTTIALPESVTVIGDEAFDICASLTSMSIAGNISEIGINPFNQCYSLSSMTISPNQTLLKFDNNALYNESTHTLISYLLASESESYTIPDGITAIGPYTFYSNNHLSQISIPETVDSIGEWAFYDCNKLENITVPSSVTSIGDHAFGTTFSQINIDVDSYNVDDDVSSSIKDALNVAPVTLTVDQGSFAEQYAIDNNINYVYPEADMSWLTGDDTENSDTAFADIKQGDSGDTVKKIQEKLIELGVLSGSADGSFGPGTESAVITFQQNNGLESSGIVDEETYKKLFPDE